MERITEFYPAYDKRNSNPSKNYGVHSVDLRMVLKGSLGAVQFLLYTGWYLPEIEKEYRAKGFHSEPLAADLGYHSPVPLYEGQETISDSCSYLDGKPCYYDGSGLNAERIFDVMLREGGDAVWKELEEYYVDTFGKLE